LTSEDEIIVYSKIQKFKVLYTRCPCSTGAFRREFRDFLEPYQKNHPDVLYNIINFYLANINSRKDEIAKSIADKNSDIEICETCGEPSSRKKCRLCEIIDNLKSEDHIEEFDDDDIPKIKTKHSDSSCNI
jgi:uncharacterized protein (TIGR00269 family)